jgi:hypothetical protein
MLSGRAVLSKRGAVRCGLAESCCATPRQRATWLIVHLSLRAQSQRRRDLFRRDLRGRPAQAPGSFRRLPGRLGYARGRSRPNSASSGRHIGIVSMAIGSPAGGHGIPTGGHHSPAGGRRMSARGHRMSPRAGVRWGFRSAASLILRRTPRRPHRYRFVLEVLSSRTPRTSYFETTVLSEGSRAARWLKSAWFRAEDPKLRFTNPSHPLPRSVIFSGVWRGSVLQAWR